MNENITCYQVSAEEFDSILELLSNSALVFGVLGLLVGFFLAYIMFAPSKRMKSVTEIK